VLDGGVEQHLPCSNRWLIKDHNQPATTTYFFRQDSIAEKVSAMPWSNGWTTEISIPPQRVNVPDNWSLLWNELLIEFSAIAMSQNYRVGTYLELPPSLEFTHNLRTSIDFVNCVSLYKLNEYWSGVNRNTELLLNEHCWRQTYWFRPRDIWKSTHRPGRCRDSGCNDS